MPRKAKSGKSLIPSAKTKEKQMTQFKLMQINLRVDEHVYRNKPISGERAESYLREISALKPQCHQDIRLLQVVEKLTRVMRQVIVEEVETEKDTNLTTIRHDVISIKPHENSLLQVQTVAHEIPIVKDNEVTLALNNVDTTQNLQTLEQCDDNSVVENKDNTENIDTRNTTVTEVSRALSNLSVVETAFSEKSLNTDVTNGDGSKISDSTIIEEQFNPCGQGFEEYDKFLPLHEVNKSPLKDLSGDTANSLHTYLNDNFDSSKTMNLQPHINNELAKDCNNTFPGDITTMPTNSANSETNINKSETDILNTKKTKKKKSDGILNKNGENKILVDTKANKRKFKPPINKPNKTTKGSAKKVNIKTVSKAVEENKITIGPQNQSVVSSCKDANIPNNMEVDLSWVENIKYVRQINKNEYIHASNITETFWDSCEFPNNWNDN